VSVADVDYRLTVLAKELDDPYGVRMLLDVRGGTIVAPYVESIGEHQLVFRVDVEPDEVDDVDEPEPARRRLVDRLLARLRH